MISSFMVENGRQVSYSHVYPPHIGQRSGALQLATVGTGDTPEAKQRPLLVYRARAVELTKTHVDPFVEPQER